MIDRNISPTNLVIKKEFEKKFFYFTKQDSSNCDRAQYDDFQMCLNEQRIIGHRAKVLLAHVPMIH
jgi:hypothetical protein